MNPKEMSGLQIMQAVASGELPFAPNRAYGIRDS